MFKQLLHMPELLRSPGQTLCTPVPADHIILAPSPCGLCNSIPASYRGVVSTKRTLSRTCSGSRRLHERTCNVRLQPGSTWPSFATAPQQINVVAFRPAMHISPTKTFPRLAQQSRPWTTPRNVVIRTLAYFRPCLG